MLRWRVPSVRLDQGYRKSLHPRALQVNLFHWLPLPGAILRLLLATEPHDLGVIPVFFSAPRLCLLTSSKSRAYRIQMTHTDTNPEAFNQRLLHSMAWSICIRLVGVFEPLAYGGTYLVCMPMSAIV